MAHSQFNTGLETYFPSVCSVPTGINIRKLILSALTVWGWTPVAWHTQPRADRGRLEGEEKTEGRMRKHRSPSSLHFIFNKSWVMSWGERVGLQGRLCRPKRSSVCLRAEELSVTHCVESASRHSSVCLSCCLPCCLSFIPTLLPLLALTSKQLVCKLDASTAAQSTCGD